MKINNTVDRVIAELANEKGPHTFEELCYTMDNLALSEARLPFLLDCAHRGENVVCLEKYRERRVAIQENNEDSAYLDLDNTAT